MTTSPAPHQGLGVPQYAWSSSPPLRRAVDLINQRQLLAILREEPRLTPRVVASYLPQCAILM